ncbi:LysM peptidoglycan-binding domain-containing protein [Desulfonatronum lacustre]|uniref:LysM peptidoglycan-binding domain-containing protein n=1 Tax=Desulfonatronum lacustre TaxID=66849 RepID=UPI0006880505|nr:LysM domain-containing protein [Desulfonatronum lacustre]SMP49092.1 LysM domain-containing protein [Desulfonatronum zhilinae]
MDKKSWLQKLESMEQERQEVEVPEEEERGSLRDALEGRGKYVILGGIGLFVLVLLVIIASSGGGSKSDRDFHDILARLEVIETKLVGLENQESGRQQALVRMQGDFSILTMRVDKLSREMKEQAAETAPSQEQRQEQRQAAAQPARQPAPQPAQQPTQQPTQPRQQQQTAATPAPAPQAAPAEQPRPAASRPVTHEVQPGETLFRISQTYGVSVDDLRRLNNISGDRINPGQVLKVRP